MAQFHSQFQPDVILSTATAGREAALSEVEGNLTTPDAIDGVNGMPVPPAVLALLASVQPVYGFRKVPFDFAQGGLSGALGALLRDDIGR
jgi:hypothetical protein